MATQRDPEIDSILNRAFEDISRRINNHMAKREKKLVKEVKTATKNTTKAEPKKASTFGKKYQKSRSSSDSS